MCQPFTLNTSPADSWYDYFSLQDGGRRIYGMTEDVSVLHAVFGIVPVGHCFQLSQNSFLKAAARLAGPLSGCGCSARALTACLRKSACENSGRWGVL
jgi:hypothetical protein